MFRYLVLFFFTMSVSLFAEDVNKLIESAKLIFEDDFNRIEKDDSKEELGKNWVTNSKSRAKGQKQCDLTGGTVKITMAKVADHGVSMRHDAPFHNGIIVCRFKFSDSKGIKFNFNDPAAKKITWAGHIAGIDVRPSKITIEDHITGKFDLKIREMRKDPKRKKEAAKILKDKQKSFSAKVDANKWHDIIIVFQGPKVVTYINSKKIGEFSSEGLNHKVKQNLAFAISSSVEVDDLKIYSLN